MKILLFTITITLCLHNHAQQLTHDEAEILFSKKLYAGVWEYYQEQLKKDSLNSVLNYKMGVCYLNSRSKKAKSIGYFKQALLKNNLGKQKQSQTYKLLGDAYYSMADYDEAIHYYEKYRNLLQGETSSDISKEIEMCKMANDLKELKELTSGFTDSKTQGRKSRNNLYAYHESKSSLKPSSPLSLPLSISSSEMGSSDKNYYEEIQDAGHYIFKRDPKTIDTSDVAMETTIATSIDGQIILIYRDNHGNGTLYSSSLHGNEWMEPVQLNKNIINKSWEPAEFVSTNGNELYFASDRDGGFGGNDIYKCKKLSNGEWGKAINMGSRINTKYDEEAPYLFPDGTTFYFSSNRNRKTNCFDNFSSSYSDTAGWSIPINVGYPVYKTNKNISNDSGSMVNNKDNYIATFINSQNKAITILSGSILDQKKTIPSYVEITVANNMTGEITGIYHPSSKTGKYAFIIPPGNNQNITYESEGYLFHSENINLSVDPNIYQLNKFIELEPIAVGSKIKLNNLFFEAGNASLSPSSDIELNKITTLLIKNPELHTEIAAYVSKTSDDKRIKQTEERLQTLISYLLDKGVNKKNIKVVLYKKKKNKSVRPEVEKYNSEHIELKILTLK